MRTILDGNIAPNDQQVRPARSMDQSAECEKKLTDLLDDGAQTLLLNFVNAKNEIGAFWP